VEFAGRQVVRDRAKSLLGHSRAFALLSPAKTAVAELTILPETGEKIGKIWWFGDLGRFSHLVIWIR
jgi:hypothetical protein